MMVACLLCIAGGIFIARFVPALFPVDEKSTITIPPIPWKSSAAEPVEPAAEPPAITAAVSALTPAPIGSDLTSLKSRIERLESMQSRTVEAASTALATAALVEAAQTSRPFNSELAQVEHLLPDSADVAALRTLARTGAPTRQVLAADFSDAASSAVAAASKPAANASLVQRIAYAVSSVVTVRRVGSIGGKAADAVLARAELRAQDGDLEQALTELGNLPVSARDAMKGWMDRARSRVEIDRGLANIRASSLRALNASRAAAQ